MQDGYEARLDPSAVAALKLTDAFLGLPTVPDRETQEALAEHFSNDQIMELLLGVGLYHGMSKVLIVLGLEPETMPITELPTPGSGG